MDRITAPYGFVPLSPTVVFPEWAQPVENVVPPLHDVPFENGLRGTLTLEIEAETPIFTRGAKEKELPFQLEDGTYALPGTAVRGVLRNVLEIATFGRFSRVNDHKYAVRDLQNRALYGDFMADIVQNLRTGKKEPMPLVNAGWLSARRNEDDEWDHATIEVCDFGKIEYRMLESVARQRGAQSFRPGNKQSSVQKYLSWGRASLDVKVNIDWRRPDAAGRRPLVSGYGVASLNEAGQTGTIVFTGQPSMWKPDQTGKRFGSGNAKHHDFVFVPAAKPMTCDVTRRVFENFEFGHSDRGQQNALGRSQEPNPEWKHWEERLKNGERVPVFFLTDENGDVTSFGLAMMFRLPYRFSIAEAARNVSADHGDRRDDAGKVFDFSEAIFGTVREPLTEKGKRGRRDERGGIALKGRVGISHARAVSACRPEGAVEAILGAPKASYYPNYVEQDTSRPGGQPFSRLHYKTWNDNDGAPRGWKRYRALTETWRPAPPSGADGRQLDLSKVGTRFHPLPKGTKFQAHVDLHNLRPEELGALLWVIDFGKDEKARHMIGMARPLGFGRARMSVADSKVVDMAGHTADLDACRKAFETYMGQKVPGWATSPQILELRELAHPVPPAQARYQRLDPGQRVNEFVDAKKAGQALPSAYAHKPDPTKQTRPSQPAAGGGGQQGFRPQGGGGPGFRGPGGHPGGGHGPGHFGGRPGGPPPRREEPVVMPKIREAPVTKEAPRPVAGGQPWKVKKRGEEVEILLTEVNRKGKWRCTVVGYHGTQGTLVGTAAADAAPGKRYRATVLVGNDPMNLELEWPKLPVG